MPLGSPSRPIRLQRGSGSARRPARRSLSGEGPGGFFSCRCVILPLVAHFPSSRFPPGEFLLPDPRAREGSLTSAVARGGRIRRGAVRTAHLSPSQPVERLPGAQPEAGAELSARSLHGGGDESRVSLFRPRQGRRSPSARRAAAAAAAEERPPEPAAGGDRSRAVPMMSCGPVGRGGGAGRRRAVAWAAAGASRRPPHPLALTLAGATAAKPGASEKGWDKA